MFYKMVAPEHLYRPFPSKAIERFSLLLPQILEAARGARKSDLVLRNVNLVDVATATIVENVSVAVYRGFVVGVVKRSKDDMFIGIGTEVFDGNGLYAVPGFIDAHVHVESSLLNPEEFSKIAVAHGTTLAAIDPHEVANVGGLDYVLRFARRASNQVLKMLAQLPPCVPPTNIELDSPGSRITAEDFEKAIDAGVFHSIGEFMDFESVVGADPQAVRKIVCAYSRGMAIYGHIPTGDEILLNAYTAAPISSCHESTSAEEVVEKLRRGMWVMLRYATTWKDAEYVLPELIRQCIDLSRVMLVSDDILVTDLVEQGHMDRAVKSMVELGVDPIKVLKMVTLNPATYLRLDNLVGIIAPGRLADIVLLESLDSVKVDTVFVEGFTVYRKGEILIESAQTSTETPLESLFNPPTIKSPRDLVIDIDGEAEEIGIVTAEIVKKTPLTRKRIDAATAINSTLALPDDTVYVSVIDRYRGESIGKGFAKGIELSSGAIAQTIGHDTHNIVVVGKTPSDMFKAFRAIENIRGGIVVVDNGKTECVVELREAGLMSSKSFREVYLEVKCLEKFFLDRGGEDSSTQLMYISLLTLPVIPEIRITPKGVVDVVSRSIISPIAFVRR